MGSDMGRNVPWKHGQRSGNSAMASRTLNRLSANLVRARSNTILRWTAAGFLEAEKSFRKLRGFAQLKSLISGLRPQVQPTKKAA